MATDDWREFMLKHANHKLEPLEATDKHFPQGLGVDPMSVGYIEVTDGHDRFWLRRSRKSIEEPFTYELMKGQVTETGLSLEVQENEIKKEMKYHFNWTPARPLDDDRIDFFIGLFKEVVKSIDPVTVRTSEYSDTDDSVSYGLLDLEVIEALMRKCAAYFLPAEVQAIRRFVESHRGSCDVMTLRMRHQFLIEQPIR
jgi:hypothetical protein